MLLSPKSLYAHSTPWKCQNRFPNGPFSIPRSNGFASRAGKRYGRSNQQRRNALVAAGTGGAGAGAFLFADDAKHYYQAAERSGRVVSTLYACINE